MKRNQLLAKMEAKNAAKYEAIYLAKSLQTLQMAQDAAMIVAHDMFNMGPGRAAKFGAAFRDTVNEIAKITVEAGRDDPELVYAKEVIDRRLKPIVGEENFTPWEERYGNS